MCLYIPFIIWLYFSLDVILLNIDFVIKFLIWHAHFVDVFILISDYYHLHLQVKKVEFYLYISVWLLVEK